MPRKRLPVRINQFIGGFITEANPLSFPENSTSDEQNIEIQEDGSRKRRAGFDVEDGYVSVDTNIPVRSGSELGRSQFRWNNVGNDGNKKLLAVQIGNYLAVHDLDSFPLSNSLIYSKVFNDSTYSNNYSYAVIDGLLVIATGTKEVTVLTYDNGTITEETRTLYIRDTFGVTAVDREGDTLTDVEFISKRPSVITNEHLYNLRNQTFGPERMTGQGDSLLQIDPATSPSIVGGDYPSNADNANSFLVANPNFVTNRTAERFDPVAFNATKPGTSQAPRGHFIIDALERGNSRRKQERNLRRRNPGLTAKVKKLLKDQTPDGATVLEQYAGRVWYAGFKGEVKDGDSRSPKMSSYILFSQVVTDPTQINKCYQAADPTSHIDPDLVETDGGFIKLDGAYNIRALKTIKSSLFVFADNGVWEISGLDRNTFTATSYRVDKVSVDGCVSNSSVASTGDSIFYWSHESINAIRRNEFGDWVVEDITESTIRTFYADIPLTEKKGSIGYYDTSLSVVRWIYSNDVTGISTTNELVLNLKYPSFTKNVIGQSEDVQGPINVSGGESVNSSVTVDITVNGVPVTVEGEIVTTTAFVEQISSDKSFYCVLLDTTPTITYTFGGYIRNSYEDWETFTGIDSPAFLVTGPLTAGEASKNKSVPYVTTYFKYTDPNNNVDTSSCLVSSRWNWTKGVGTSKWSTPREAFRITRPNEDNSVVSTRNKIRGHGRAVSFKFESSPSKDMHIYGYDHNLDVNEED